MTHYLYIDTENVGNSWIPLMDQADADTVMLLFYTAQTSAISMPQLGRLLNFVKRADVQLINCTVGKDALDFQLVSYLGYMIREAPEEDYCIISNDKAFELVGRFWQDKNVNVCSAVCLEQAKESGEHSRLHSELEKLITNSDELEFVEKCINELTTKSGINNRIVKKYGTTRAGEIYRLIKPLLTDKKGDKRQK